MAKTIAAHITEVMKQLDRLHFFEGEERIRAVTILHGLFKEIQSGRVITAPLYAREDRLMPIVENYRKCLGPGDILDDLPGPFAYRLSGTQK